MRTTDRQATRQETSDDALHDGPRNLCDTIYRALLHQPRSVDELMVDLELPHTSCSARVNELMRSGWIKDKGERTLTRAGRSAIVWEANTVPIPISAAKPTRAELARRIALAQLAISTGTPLATVQDILNGDIL